MRPFSWIATMLLLCGTAEGSLVGSSVFGNLTLYTGSPNFFDAANGSVPASGFLNSPPGGPTVLISASAVEFGFADGANQVSVNFDGDGFTLIDLVTGGEGGGSTGFTMAFTSAAFAGMMLTNVSDSFDDGLLASVNNQTVTIAWTGGRGPGLRQAAFTLELQIPEPASGLLWAGGITVLGGLMLRTGRRGRVRHDTPTHDAEIVSPPGRRDPHRGR